LIVNERLLQFLYYTEFTLSSQPPHIQSSISSSVQFNLAARSRLQGNPRVSLAPEKYSSTHWR